MRHLCAGQQCSLPGTGLGGFQRRARLVENQSFDTFFSTLANRGKARLTVHCEIRLADGTLACSLNARFVATLNMCTTATFQSLLETFRFD